MRDLAKPAPPLFGNAHSIADACGTCYIPGYLIVRARDAVDSLSQMNPAALASLGLTLAMVIAAIEAAVQPMRVYCALFSEQTCVVHFHRFLRTEWLTAPYFAAHPDETEISGPQLIDWARRTFHTPIGGMDRDETLQKIQGWLAPSANENSARRKTSLPL